MDPQFVEAPDETLRRIKSDNYKQAAAKIQRIKDVMQEDFSIAVDPRMALLNVWLILQRVEREGLL
jgi:hypothetical protein